LPGVSALALQLGSEVISRGHPRLLATKNFSTTVGESVNRSDIEFIEAQTKRLEAMGIVLRERNGEYFVCMPCQIGRYDKGPLHPHPKRGRRESLHPTTSGLKHTAGASHG